MFCETCIGVLHHHRHTIASAPRPFYRSETEPYVECSHHLTCKSLVAAAANGCPFCRPTWEYLSGPQQDLVRASNPKDNVNPTTDASPPKYITSAELSGRDQPGKFAFLIEYNREMFPELANSKGFFILEKEDAHMLQQDIHTKGHVTSNSTSSHESMQTTAMWLRSCAQSHTQCNTLENGEQWYPTRLLHLVESQGNESCIRLIRTAEQPLDGPYATLSHCWGNVRPLKLTHSMASDPNHRFPLADMPKTFQEAIQVSIKLGIQYLWVDSLCIIQEGDDRRDWYREAGLMNKVYMHSYLNIAAADAEDSTEGIFRSRVPLPLGCQRIAINIKIDGPGAEFVNCIMTDFKLWSRSMNTSYLSKRGWVFQERFLAPRILHFCRDQLFWECKERIACETFPEQLAITDVDYIDTFMKTSERQFRATQSALCGDFWIDFWDRFIVCQYSCMKLTVSTDRLIALSGIAKYFMTRIEDVYVAGMWRRHLEDSLLWSLGLEDLGGLNTICLRPRPTPYRSPTWSWASVDGPVYVYPHSEVRESLIHVEDVVLSHATDDILGAVTDGWLDLRGSLKPMTLWDTEDDADWYMIAENSIISEPNGMASRIGFTLSHIMLDILPGDALTVSTHNAQEHYFFMPCALDKASRKDVHCLLFKLVDTEKVLFERIGYCSTDNPDKTKLLLVDLDEETKARLPCLRYENGLHTIRII